MNNVDELITKEMLPSSMVPEKEIWEKVGFVFEKSDDEAYYFARIPQNWYFQPNLIDESLSIIDDAGLVRAHINCSTNNPSMKLYRRFDICIRQKRFGDTITREVYYPTTGDVINSLVFTKDTCKDLKESLIKAETESIRNAKKYLDSVYPNWGRYEAYWDLERPKVNKETRKRVQK